MLIHTLPAEPLTLTATPLTGPAFAPFGDVLTNPRPDAHPSTTPSTDVLPCGAVSTNQGTAIQYRDIAVLQDLYGGAPSGQSARARMTMFVCAAQSQARIAVRVLERHPFTSQTFVPLTADTTKRYLVVVAPDEAGLPHVPGLTAFLVTGDQAVTYRAGTWHAPMIALGPVGSTVDFVVVQFANDVPVEDCEEVALRDGEGGEAGIVVRWAGDE